MPNDACAFRHRVEVRFRDCDPMGHVNHAVYFTYLEVCRFAFWRALTGRRIGPDSGIILARAECDYRAPAVPGELLEVRLDVADIGRSSFTLVYTIVNADGRLVAEAKTVLVAYDYSAGRVVPLTDADRALLERARAGAVEPSA
jgi:acyl-CoA thioester hydrolase